MSVPIMSPEIVPVVVMQHAEEAAFLWHLRSVASHSPHYDLHELGNLDERIEAHLDGLRIAGRFAWDLCMRALDEEDAGSYFAAGVLAYGSHDPARLEDLFGAPVCSEAQVEGLQAAVGWVPATQARYAIHQLLARDQPTFTRIAIVAGAQRGYDPGPALLSALDNSNVSLAAFALKAIGELGRVDLLAEARERLDAPDPEIRLSANWSVALLSDNESAISYLASAAASALPAFHLPVLELALRKMTAEKSYALVLELQQNPGNERIGIFACGIFGDSRFIPWLIQATQHPELARAAGEAFTMITGVDLAEEHLTGPKPETFVSGPTEDPDDDNVDLDSDENLPWPDSAALEGWWKNHGNEWTPGIRHLMGKPITVEWLRQILRTGRQRQRAAAALELKIMHPAQPFFNVQAPAFLQRLLLEIQP